METTDEDADPSSSSEQLSRVVDYLSSLLPVVLSADSADLRGTLLSPTNLRDHVASLLLRFVNDAALQCIYVHKHRLAGGATTSQSDHAGLVDNGDTQDDQVTTRPAGRVQPRFTYSVTTILSWQASNVASLALIKRVPLIDTSSSIADQLHFLNLFGPANALPTSSDAIPLDDPQPSSARTAASDRGRDGQQDELDGAGTRAQASATANPYESLHSIVHLAVQPFFEAYVTRSEHAIAATGPIAKRAPAGGDDDATAAANTGIPVAKKKFAELELSLLHLQQNVEIPDIVLRVHPVVMRALDKARAHSLRVSPELVEPASLLGDSSFLNRLQSEVNNWIKEIKSITQLNRAVEGGTAAQEVNFWLSMERALEGIEEQLRSEPINLTLDILKHAKRFHVTVSFTSDTGLKEAMDVVHKYNLLMKDFPLNDLLSATDLDKIRDGLLTVFGHLNKKLKLSPYPIRRALPLVEAISKDLSDQLLRVLIGLKLMYANYAAFETHMALAAEIFAIWDDLIKEFTNIAREVTRKRAEKFIPIKITAWHSKSGLQARIEYIRGFRKHHEQLVQMVSPTRGVVGSSAEVAGLLGGLDMEEEVRMAWEEVKHVEVLDTGFQATQVWVTAETAYNERVSRVENQIIARLRDKLGTARNASEMFRVFSRFNALFVRPKIRGAIQEYQTALIDSVKEDIAALHTKFRTSYRTSQAYHMSQLRDVPPIAGAVMWAKQIERQLNISMKRVEDVLGKGWELYAEGARLASESTSFRRKLDTRPIYEAWLHEINRRDMRIEGRLFDITKQRRLTSKTEPARRLVNGDASHSGRLDDDDDQSSTPDAQLVLGINFDPQIITLFKEVRNLLWLGFSVPHAIGNLAKDAKRVYPYAVSLMETVRTYAQTLEKVQGCPDIQPLAAEYHRDVQNLIAKGITLRWEYFVNTIDARQQIGAILPASAPALVNNDLLAREGRHALFVREFASGVSTFQDRTAALLEMHEELQVLLKHVETCPYDASVFHGTLAKVQKIVDRLSLEGFANLEEWVSALDSKIASILLARLQVALIRWSGEMSRASSNEHAKEASLPNGHQSRSEQEPSGSTIEASLRVMPVKHELRLQDQVIYLDPPVHEARQSFYEQLQMCLGVACNLQRLRAPGDAMANGAPRSRGKSATSYSNLLDHLTPDALQKPFVTIEARVQELSRYVDQWLSFQALWDLEAEAVYKQLGDNLADWQQLLTEIRKTRATFDTSETFHDLGIASVHYDQVQAKVNAKYDAWQRDILNRFGQKLGAAIRDMHTEVHRARLELEQHSIDTSSTAQAVSLITFAQDLKRKVSQWTPELELFQAGQRTLNKQRFQFPTDWLSTEQLEVEWNAFSDLLARKNDAIQEQLAALQLKISSEDTIVQNKIAEAIAAWDAGKPIQADLICEDALAALRTFEVRLGDLQTRAKMVSKAKEALEMETSKEELLAPVMDELRDLKAVWTGLSGLWAQLNDMRETPWATVQPRKIRQQLESLLASSREMPSRMRQYAAFEYVQEIIRSRLKSNNLISELRSEALRERHWRDLYKSLRSSSGTYQPSRMTLGTVWDLDLKRNESLVNDIILRAQGEMALEEFMRQVKETWTNYSLEMVNYQNLTRLVKGWDDLFAKCSENLSSLGAMKHSPYYKVFEEETLLWEDRLNRVHVLFDTWIDVQRQWVYLEGIFSGSADIKHLLPVESSRFSNINSEFLAFMKKVAKSPYVLEVLNIPGAQKSLERLAELLGKIQKALGEYLERERASFPRFYFVGDEDLLEIIGNSKDLPRVMKHLKKMFAGIASLVLAQESSGPVVLGVVSREGETVALRDAIKIADFPKINDWLAKLDAEVKTTLALMLAQACNDDRLKGAGGLQSPALIDWIEAYPAQVVVLAMQIHWTARVESALREKTAALESCSAEIREYLDLLADTVLHDLDPNTRTKCEGLITELVHERDVVRSLQLTGVDSVTAFEWAYHMRFYLKEACADGPCPTVQVQMADAEFTYGFEYQGIIERLVQTPLTDRCYSTLTQALSKRLGGSPFGPAGTGKTETVKALGSQLGRFVLVFCCDENFDFQSMGRIFIGLCQVGAWGCFDEFNRLEERMLSAVSQQIQTIQVGLKTAVSASASQIELLGRRIKISTDTGIFITMNPGYAGRSNLPDNLKKLFRSIAMTKPDKELIAQVLLFSQGFRGAEGLAKKAVPFFSLCLEQLSDQPHYDFGLRALKAVLASAGFLKRQQMEGGTALMAGSVAAPAHGSAHGHAGDRALEAEILIQSIMETIVPKLVADDVGLLTKLLQDVFPGTPYRPINLEALKGKVLEVCKQRHLQPADGWMQKVLQLYQIQKIQHGVMMVGPAGSGKSEAWRVLLSALQGLDGVEGISYVIEPKAIAKDELYGTLDPTTREWNDGLFTHILRKIVDNARGESQKRHWIVFDGDVDPEWVENLNSVLDDNKLLTLPNGERLGLPPNVRIMFEVETLRFATLATVSRCGTVWFNEGTLTPQSSFYKYLSNLASSALDSSGEEGEPDGVGGSRSNSTVPPQLQVQQRIADLLRPFFAPDGLVEVVLKEADTMNHIMDFTSARAISTLFSLLNQAIRAILSYNSQHSDFPLSDQKIASFMTKRLLLALVWAFAGDTPLHERGLLGLFVSRHSGIDTPDLQGSESLIDFDVNMQSGDWVPWQASVPQVDIETHAVTSADVVIPTVDTVRHEDVLYSWLSDHKPLILCGPPGSGKTMTLFGALRKLPDLEIVGLNFSSATTPELLLRTFEQYCEYKRTPNGVTLSPTQVGKWLVVFCDEINLPGVDKYGTQKAIAFLRQLVEHGGYWRTRDESWVKLERIQFVGACNPPTDPGRVPLSHRFLRHAPLVMVDYPGEASLVQIYSTFNRALLKVIPMLRAYADPLTAAMVQVYLASQRHFTTDVQAHYIYSPRELTRWMRGIYEAIKPLEDLTVEGLVRVWAHEGLRLFQDRLVDVSEREWTDRTIDEAALQHFPTIKHEEALARPILFSNWTSRHYISVDREELREFTKARLRVFYEEELDVPLVLFNDVLDHVLRIDRVFRQVQGHMLLIGISGSGKTTLSRFVAWMNGLNVAQINVHNRYTGEDFDNDLRALLRRAGCKGEKICFIMDESNVLDSGFLERMNTLLANAEIPGLFEGDEFASLMSACREGAQRDGLILDSQEELYKWFTQQIARNLHVVFTMNPPEAGLASRAATSPALFNRCVLDWFGDWSEQAFYQVASDFTATVDLDNPSYSAPPNFPVAYSRLDLPPHHRAAVCNALVAVQSSVRDINQRLARRHGRYNHVTPRHYLDFVTQYVKLYGEKREDLEEQQRHLNVGLEKLRATVSQVAELRASLALKRTELENKSRQANDKLQTMVADQREAEQQKAASQQVQAALQQQNADIAARKEVVMSDLAAAEPAVLDAQAAVSNIKKQHLTEVRSMANPPEAVKLAMESVCTLLGYQIDSWRTVQGIIRRDDFITSIVNFDTETMVTRRLRDKMVAEFLNRPAYNYENVNRASRACGPLVKWVFAQIGFSEILDKVGPLRDEVDALEQQAATTQHQVSTILVMIDELQERIERYKEEYATLISETQAIKTEMERVQTKVDRSLTLLASLESERDRWHTGSEQFEDQMATLPGDVLLSAAFLAYGGYYDQNHRESLWHKWTSQLDQSGIKYKNDLSLVEYLSTADARLAWHESGLPNDDLSIENAIVLNRFNRYPLIIDPTGQAATFLTQHYQQRKIAVTSFLDEAFLKNLESALRFGTTLLVQDAESLDPIINAVLNRELRKAGGRVLVRLGSMDIDFSPAFTLFLSTRDGTVDFPPDVCSRVSFANFTMTRKSLQTQSLSQILRVERPDIDKKRTDIIKLQGEFRTKLRHLERSLLDALNESRGNILDDEKVLETLERLKLEAADVGTKVAQTESVMRDIESVTSQYMPLATASSSIYFALDELSLVNRFYQFSLQFFRDIFGAVLSSPPTRTTAESRSRSLLDDLFLQTFRRTSRALLHRDHSVLAVMLAQIKLRSLELHIDDDQMDLLLGDATALSGPQTRASLQAQTPDWLSPSQVDGIVRLAKLPAFRSLPESISGNSATWQECLASQNSECIPYQFPASLSTIDKAFGRILIVNALQPDRLLPAVDLFIEQVFQADSGAITGYDLAQVVREEVPASSPIGMCSIPGYDAAFRVESLLALHPSVQCAQIAMGSAEGVSLADQAISSAARTGSWVLLKNVHLAASWLSTLEKRLQNLAPHPSFRIFLTMETSPAIPLSILRQSRLIMNEPPPGLRANLLDSLKSISPEHLDAPGPSERYRLYFSLAWLHGVIVERLRYAPVGFSKVYEFNDSDRDAALSTIDSFVNEAAKGRSNVDPAAIPYKALRRLLKHAVYGGRVDSDNDQVLLDSFVDHLFSQHIFDADFTLVGAEAGHDSLLAPEGTRMQDFVAWCQRLPEREPPSLLSLPPNAEQVLAIEEGKAFIAKLRRLRSQSEVEETVSSDLMHGSADGKGAKQSSAMRALEETCRTLMKLLLQKDLQMESHAVSVDDAPLLRFFNRERAIAADLLLRVHTDLELLIGIAQGRVKQSNHARSLMQAVSKGDVPSTWIRYKVDRGTSLAAWTSNLAERVAMQLALVAAGDPSLSAVWLGGLMRPTGWITASRQEAAHRQGVSLESLQLRLVSQLPPPSQTDTTPFPVRGLALQGATWRRMPSGKDALQANDGASTLLDEAYLCWEAVDLADTESAALTAFSCPVYLTARREELLFNVPLSCEQSGSLATLVQRGVCVVTSL